MTIDEANVRSAADAMVEAFGKHDSDAYFAAFAADATFIFHNLDRMLDSRAAYEDEWRLWETRDGFRVVSCKSTSSTIKVLGNTAIFTHLVETVISIQGEAITNLERETIVFSRDGANGWLAIHEHLSNALTKGMGSSV